MRIEQPGTRALPGLDHTHTHLQRKKKKEERMERGGIS
jgi:hypothetical protein